ncbi:MAG: OmpA family protein, partial [Isosphaeraceae bacterium]
RKKGGEATCNATFVVTEPPKNPPTMSCSASPTSLVAGASATITCNCVSPDSVAVDVGGWSAPGGSISGSGSTATLNTSGASHGPITASATCSDSRGLSTQASTLVTVEIPPVSPEVKQLEARLALHSIYFPTAQPTAQNPERGLLASQQETLLSLASDFRKYLALKPGANLILESHADPRGSVEYNQGLSERRVERTRRFLIEHDVPAANIQTKAFGKEQNLTDAQVKDAVEQNPELTPQERQRILKNMRTIILASNRRVDVTLSTTGQQSVRQFPFNAADSLTLIKEAETKHTRGPAATKKAKPADRQ